MDIEDKTIEQQPDAQAGGEAQTPDTTPDAQPLPIEEELTPEELEEELADGDEDAAPLKLEVPEEPEKEGIENETPESFFSARDFRSVNEPRGKLFATNWLADISTVHDCELVKVQFKNTRSGFYRNVDKLDLKIGDVVAVEASPGHDIGEVVMVGPLVALQMKKSSHKREVELGRVFRKARATDLEKYEEAKSRELDTMIRSRRIAAELGLDMKIGDVEYQGDGGKAIFYYIADERVDFRKLIRLLADAFKVRIEMKQIGARQEAGRIGGIGPCGRPLCCASWMTHFVSVGTSLARMQDLSMNPQKLAGQCAKLKCCLNFEAAAYAESQKKLPHKDVILQTKDADYYLFKTDVLQRLVTYSTEKGQPVNAVTISGKRAFEIIALNKQGIKVDSLSEESEKAEPERPEFFDLAEQDSLTRFDNSKRRHRGKKGKGNGHNDEPQARQGDERDTRKREGKKREQGNNSQGGNSRNDNSQNSGKQRRQERDGRRHHKKWRDNKGTQPE